MKMMYIGKPVLGRRLKVLSFFFLGVIVVYLIISHYVWRTDELAFDSNPREKKGQTAAANNRDALWDWLENDSRHRDELLLRSVPTHLPRQHKCPACFGDDICDDILSGDLQIEVPKTQTSTSLQGVYFGRWQGKDIVLKTLATLEGGLFKKYDEFICSNQSLPKDCDVSSAILNPRSMAMQEILFLPENLQQAWKLGLSDSGPGAMSFAICATSELIQELSWGFDLDHDGQLNEAQVAMLFTSMVINPEAILLRFFSSLKVDLPVPEFLGACGRVVVASHGGTSLANFLTAPFQQRAELALQALEIVHLFIYGDPTWFILFGDFKVENFAVSGDGQLTVIDLEDIGIIDKRSSQNFQFGQVEYSTPCNHACFKYFAAGLWDSASPYHAQFCEQTPHVAGMAMYSLLCANVLADRATRTRTDPDGDARGITSQGLLADPPAAHQELVQALLEECIEESAPAGRMQAVEELKEWLEDMLQPDQ